jgi:acetyl esterase
MPVDPAFLPLFERAAAAPPPAPDSDPVALARAGTDAMFVHPAAPAVETIDRTIVGPDGNELPLRIYRPTAPGGAVAGESTADASGVPAAPLPLLVYFHGGGFIAGGLASHDGTVRELTVRTGCVSVAVDYRLAPGHPFPAAVEDCIRALHWAVDNADSLGIDPERVAIGGDSAGGNLAACVAIANRDRHGPALVAQLLVYPVIDPACATASMARNGSGYLLTADSMRFMWSCYLADAADRSDARANPLAASTLEGLPPATVITAEYDPLCDEGESYARALAAAGVPVTCSRYAGQIHGFFSMYALAPQASVATEQAARALRRAFGTA